MIGEGREEIGRGLMEPNDGRKRKMRLETKETPAAATVCTLFLKMFFWAAIGWISFVSAQSLDFSKFPPPDAPPPINPAWTQFYKLDVASD